MISGAIHFHVAVHIATNVFEVIESESAVATGTVRVLENVKKGFADIFPSNKAISNEDNLYLNNSDFYKELRLRGYQYKNSFRTIDRVNCEG